MRSKMKFPESPFVAKRRANVCASSIARSLKTHDARSKAESALSAARAATETEQQQVDSLLAEMRGIEENCSRIDIYSPMRREN